MVSDDSIVVGMVGYPETSFTYVAIDNIKFEYAGFNVGIYLQALTEEINLYINDNSEVLLPSIAQTLGDAAIDAIAVLGGSDEEMAAEFAKLNALYKEAQSSITKVAELSELTVDFVSFVESTNYPGADVATNIIDAAQKIIDGGDELATFQTIVEMVNRIQQALWDYQLSQVSSKECPADYTFFVQNPSFEATTGWNWKRISNGSDVWAGNCRPAQEGGSARRGFNFYGTVITKLNLYQELTGLPNGLYAVSAEMITQTGLATDQHLYVASSTNSSVSANLDIEGWNTYEWKTLQTGIAVVTDGKLIIGAASSQGGTAAEGWFQVTNFQLAYYGPYGEDDLSVAWDNTLLYTQALSTSLLKGDATTLNSALVSAQALADAHSYVSACSTMQTPIAVAESDLATYTSFKKAAYQNAIDVLATLTDLQAIEALNAGLDFADAILSADTTHAVCLSSISEKLSAYNAYAVYLEEVGTLIANHNNYKAEYVTLVKELITQQIAELTNHFRSVNSCSVLQSQLKAAAEAMQKSVLLSITAGSDVTNLAIVNPDIDDALPTGWSYIKGVGNGPTTTGQHWSGNTSNRYLDSYGATGRQNFTAYQLLTDIPNGTYSLSLSSRTNGDNAFAFAAVEPINGVLTDSLTCLSIKHETTQWCMFKNYNNTGGEMWMADSLLWITDNIATDIYNANGGIGWGWCTIYIQDIVVSHHQMIIGITADSTLTCRTPFTGNWFSADEFRLTLTALGDNAEYSIGTQIEKTQTTNDFDIHVENGVITSSSDQPIKIYTIDGKHIDNGTQLQKGIYLIRGGASVRKVLIR